MAGGKLILKWRPDWKNRFPPKWAALGSFSRDFAAPGKIGPPQPLAPFQAEIAKTERTRMAAPAF
jgi:hypothetical protein